MPTHACDGAKVLTWALGIPDGHINSKAKLQGENTIQDTRDTFVLPCNGVGSSNIW